jgi:hypothetical protein
MIMLKSTGMLVVAALAMLVVVGRADASLSTFKSFTGNDLASTDGCGSNTATCTLVSNLQAGSEILGAWLYSSTFNSTTDPNGITFNKGLTSTTPTFTPLGVNNGFLQAWRADVTGFVTANANLGSLTTWTVNEGGKTAALDGEALVIVYKNATAQPNTHTITILDGFSSSSGDTSKISFTALPPGFTAHMFLGDGFSFDGTNPLAPTSTTQVSTIKVNGTTLTEVAGHCDDNQDNNCANGSLFTMGGTNAGPKTDPFTPFPCAGIGCIGSDHEAYDLANVFKVGDTSGTLTTVNPSGDDNIFLEVFDISGTAVICQVNCSVPEPASLVLLGAGLVGLGVYFRRR